MKKTENHLAKRATVMFLSVALSVFLGACMFMDTINGSGNIVAEVHELSGFNDIRAGGSSDVQITLGDSWRVELITDDNLHEYVEITVANKTLHIKNREMVNLRPSDKLIVRVVMPALYDIVASGASSVTIDSEIAQTELSVSASGSSDVHLNVKLDKLTARCSGSSDIYIGGYSRSAKVSASGSSDFRGKEFTCEEADVNLSGSSDMYAIIREKVSGNLSGSSDLHLSGSPTVKVSTSGSSDVRNF